jgi:hypothetical protein
VYIVRCLSNCIDYFFFLFLRAVWYNNGEGIGRKERRKEFLCDWSRCDGFGGGCAVQSACKKRSGEALGGDNDEMIPTACLRRDIPCHCRMSTASYPNLPSLCQTPKYMPDHLKF